MNKDFDLYIYNNLTNEPIIIHNFGNIMVSGEDISSRILFIYLKDFIKNQVPFRVEMVFIK